MQQMQAVFQKQVQLPWSCIYYYMFTFTIIITIIIMSDTVWPSRWLGDVDPSRRYKTQAAACTEMMVQRVTIVHPQQSCFAHFVQNKSGPLAF